MCVTFVKESASLGYRAALIADLLEITTVTVIDSSEILSSLHFFKRIVSKGVRKDAFSPRDKLAVDPARQKFQFSVKRKKQRDQPQSEDNTLGSSVTANKAERDISDCEQT